MIPARAILEREHELARVEQAVRRTADGEGSVLVLRGPAGIGKTELLRAARRACEAHGVTVLAGTGALLDRGFAFGVVHQLLDPVLAAADPERRARLTSGAAALSEVVLGSQADVAPGGSDPSHAVLHGLYWLTANLAEERPLALLVDDAHWADRPSLRFLEFLARRLEGIGLLVVVARRDHEPGAEEQLLEEISAGPFAHDLVPAPLSSAATGALIADVLGEAPEPRFSEICHEVTGGSPLLVREVGRAAAEAGLHGREDEGGQVATLGAAGIAGTVRRRLGLLGAGPEAVARAVSVLGPGASVADLAALADLPADAVPETLDALVLAGVLDEGRDFVHPVVGEAVDATIPPARRAALHRAAADLLAARGERPAVLARHLLLTEPAGDPWTARTLAGAAAAAAAEGAPDVAIVHLRRALREPPAEAERGSMLLTAGELGVAGAEQESARELLEQALACGLTPDEEARALVGLAVATIFADPPESARLLQQAVTLARDPQLQATVEAVLLDVTGFDARLGGLRDELLTAGVRTGSPSPTLSANLVLDESYRCRPADVVLGHAANALDDQRLLQLLGPESLAYNLLINGLRMAEQPERALEALEHGHAAAARQGSRLGMIFMSHAHAFWHWHFGSQASSVELVRTILEPIRQAGLRLSLSTLLAVYAEALLERDEPDAAAAALESFGFGEADRHSIAAPDYLAARAQVRREQGRLGEARSDLQDAYDYIAGRGWRAPMKSRAGIRLAEVLAQEGDRGRALELLDDAERAARDAGTGGALGATLRARARVVGDEDPDAALALLEAAVAAHRKAPLLLERGWALHDLGVRLRAAGKRTAAREPLREALELAQRTDGSRLARLAREELLATGARPRREALSGPDALTPSERRVAELAAKGLSNREIAQSLWVTRKTVEVHLGSTYGKLGIRSRTQLADALAAG